MARLRSHSRDSTNPIRTKVQSSSTRPITSTLTMAGYAPSRPNPTGPSSRSIRDPWPELRPRPRQAHPVSGHPVLAGRTVGTQTHPSEEEAGYPALPGRRVPAAWGRNLDQVPVDAMRVP